MTYKIKKSKPKAEKESYVVTEYEEEFYNEDGEKVGEGKSWEYNKK